MELLVNLWPDLFTIGINQEVTGQIQEHQHELHHVIPQGINCVVLRLQKRVRLADRTQMF